MFLRCSKRLKDGKEHFYWSAVENRRLHGGKVAQRHVLYLGELNGRQEASWRKTVALFGQDDDAPRQVTLFPDDHAPVQSADDDLPIVRINLGAMRAAQAASVGCLLAGLRTLAAAWP